MKRKNKQGKEIIVKCANCIKKEAKEEFMIDADEYGCAYFCSKICNLKFAMDYDFDEDITELLGDLCIEWRIYTQDKIIKSVLKDTARFLESSSGRKVAYIHWKEELTALKKQLTKTGD